MFFRNSFTIGSYEAAAFEEIAEKEANLMNNFFHMFQLLLILVF